MTNYQFHLVASVCGPAEIDAFGGKLGHARIAAIARQDFGRACTSARAWCEKWAEQLGNGPETIAVEAYDVSAGGKRRFTLYYTPWSDSGTLFIAGSARTAEFQLWPDGFRPEGAEAAALSEGFRAEIAAQVARWQKQKKRTAGASLGAVPEKPKRKESTRQR